MDRAFSKDHYKNQDGLLPKIGFHWEKFHSARVSSERPVIRYKVHQNTLTTPKELVFLH